MRLPYKAILIKNRTTIGPGKRSVHRAGHRYRPALKTRSAK
jgi:hypothetical protein